MTDLTFDFDKVTPRMLDDFERESGSSLFSFMDGDDIDLTKLSGKALAGVIWLALRTSGQPDATFDQAMDTPVTSIQMADEPDPTNASNAS